MSAAPSPLGSEDGPHDARRVEDGERELRVPERPRDHARHARAVLGRDEERVDGEVGPPARPVLRISTTALATSIFA
jgi:hypothetical protein